MRSRRSLSLTVPALLVALVLAFALGGAGTATAAGLTPKAVKKIATKVATEVSTKVATKVVAQQAAGLTVARAASAGNADTLGGRAPAAYEQRVLRVPITPLSSGLNGLRWSLPPVPAGTYLASLSVSAALPSATSPFRCRLEEAGTPAFKLVMYGALNSGYATIDGSRLTTLTGAALTLACDGAVGTTSVPASGIGTSELVLAPVDAVTTLANATPAP